MPAPVLVVHDEQNTRELAVAALRDAFLEVVGFDDPLKALDAIEASSRVRVLVTRMVFGPGKLNGVALARMVRVKRPGTKVVFVAREEDAPYAEGLGVFLPGPLNPDLLTATVSRLLLMDRENSLAMTRIVTTTYRYKRPPRKRKAVALEVPAIVRAKRSPPGRMIR